MKACPDSATDRTWAPTRRGFLAASLWGSGGSLARAQTAQTFPDGDITRKDGVTATLIDPTTRYKHGVFGTVTEAGGFVIEQRGRKLVYRLGADAVFEDRRVRLADIDGDGRLEAIVVKAYLNRGAALAVFRIGAERIEPLVESPAIGTSNRWLNPVGIGDFTGTGEAMIAAVVTPHLAGSLRLYRLSGAALVQVAAIDGYTNHILGSRDLDLGVMDDIDGDGIPEIVLPTLDRRQLAAVSFRKGVASLVRVIRAPARITRLNSSRGGKAVVTTETGGVVEINLRSI